MKEFFNKIKSIIKVNTFFNYEIIILGLMILASNIIYHTICDNIRTDSLIYSNEVIELQNNIIRAEMEMFNFILNERGSIINDSLSYDNYKIIIEDYIKLYGGDKYIDSLMNRKLEIKKEYLDIHIKPTTVHKIKINFDRKFIIGNPIKHFDIDTKSYRENVLENVNNLILKQQELLKENILIDKIILHKINDDIYILSLQEKENIKTLNEKINIELNKIKKYTMIHTICVLILLVVITIDIRKIFKRNKRRRNVIDIMMNNKINEQKKES